MEWSGVEWSGMELNRDKIIIEVILISNVPFWSYVDNHSIKTKILLSL